MLVISMREFRANQSKYLRLANTGENVVLRSRGEGSFILTPAKYRALSLSPETKASIERSRAEYKAGMGTRCKTAEEAIAFIESL
jgi:prevent-host-death family protein